MNKLVAAVVYVAAMAATQSSAFAQDRGTIRPQPLTGSTAAQVREMQKQELAFLVAPIKSASDMQEYSNILDMTHSPLKALSYEARQRFIGSLTFNESGLTGFHYGDLQRELSPSQIYQVLALFGKQHATKLVVGDRGGKGGNAADKAVISSFAGGDDQYGDYQDYKCSSRATCSTSSSDICMSSC